jgi:hypothetical protein
MNNESNNHHFLPQSILKNFTYDKKQHIHVYDKKSKKHFTNTISTVGSENKYNTFFIGGKEFNLEQIYSEYDSKVSYVTSKIIEYGNLYCLSGDDYSFLYYMMLVQLERSPIQRSTYIHLSEELNRFINKTGYKSAYKVIDENSAKILSLKFILQEKNDLFNVICKRPIVLLKGNSFITSDNAVITHSHSPYDNGGLISKYLEMIFPISSKYCLSVVPEILIGIDKRKVKNQALLNILVGMETGESVIDSSEDILFRNSLQIIRSKRFIYSSETLDKISSELYEVFIKKPEQKTSVSVVYNTKNNQIRKQKHLVIEINLIYEDYDIVDYENKDETLIIEIDNTCKLLNYIGVEIDRISIFDNQYEVRMMRYVHILRDENHSNRLIIEPKIKLKQNH